ncbi:MULTISPECIES: hypothetical protein [unclassified Moorena]|uniref:hypothetical protein n=1 Tax=unclassified Moorena TaxID=2683338 RepID=UPI0013FEED9F|nr:MULTISPECIES: hypothetical protein [unclassified Moorena]NEO16132.1 hypothetical protein [Moorena sp. SIO3E8]NEQ02662.1 hypothetical protein [Moorena sp. SIO3F7]
MFCNARPAPVLNNSEFKAVCITIRYTGLCSLLPVPSCLFPVPRSAVPCSLKSRNLYLTELQTAVSFQCRRVNQASTTKKS